MFLRKLLLSIFLQALFFCSFAQSENWKPLEMIRLADTDTFYFKRTEPVSLELVQLGNLRFIQAAPRSIITHFPHPISPQNTSVPSIPASRKWVVGGIHAGIYGGSLALLNEAWYSGYPKAPFHSFDDSREWMQMDKFGHFYYAYLMSTASAATWRWAGLNNKHAAIAGSLCGSAFQTVIEFLDARSAHWGWSWTDVAANTAGSLFFLSQQLAWNQNKILVKYSAFPKSYDDPALVKRTNEIAGPSFFARALKDYNGQTYWLSANIRSFFPRQSRIPSWLNLSVGTGAEGLFGGEENLAKNSAGQVTFDRRDIPRVRQWFLAPDIDFTKIPTHSKFVRTVFVLLNAIKMPAPALELRQNKLMFHWLYF